MKKLFYAIGSVITFLLLYYAVAALVSLIFIAFYLSHGYSQSGNTLFNILSKEQSYNIVILAFLLLTSFYIFFYKFKKRRVSELIETKPVTPASIIFSAITGFSFYLVVKFCLSFFLGDTQSFYISINDVLHNGSPGRNLGTYIITTMIILPIVEEAAHRGVLFGVLKRKVPLGFALFIQSAVYALTYSEPSIILYTLILGIIAGAVYYWHKSILLPIVIHLSFNASALLINITSISRFYDTYDSIFFIVNSIILPLALLILYGLSLRTKHKSHISVVKKVQA